MTIFVCFYCVCVRVARSLWSICDRAIQREWVKAIQYIRHSILNKKQRIQLHVMLSRQWCHTKHWHHHFRQLLLSCSILALKPNRQQPLFIGGSPGWLKMGTPRDRYMHNTCAKNIAVRSTRWECRFYAKKHDMVTLRWHRDGGTSLTTHWGNDQGTRKVTVIKWGEAKACCYHRQNKQIAADNACRTMPGIHTHQEG